MAGFQRRVAPAGISAAGPYFQVFQLNLPLFTALAGPLSMAWLSTPLAAAIGKASGRATPSSCAMAAEAANDMAANIAAASILDFIEVLPISAVFARSFPARFCQP